MRRGGLLSLSRSPLLWSVVLVSPVALFGLHRFGPSDFVGVNLPALDALRAGNVGGYLDHATVDMGSYLLRLPLIFLPNLWGGGSLALYRILALPALIGLVWLSTDLWWRSRRIGVSAVAASCALVLCILNPFVVSSLIRTHPEDLAGGLLCIAAVYAARGGRSTVTGLLLGLAIANKAWAVVAVVPVLWLLASQRVRAFLIAGAVPALVLMPLVVRALTKAAGAAGGSSAGLSQVTSIANSSYVLKPWEGWWFFGDSHHLMRSHFGDTHPLYRTPATWITHLSHPLAVLVPAVLCLWLASRLDRRRWTTALLLLAFALQVRCLLDAWNIDYYEVPFTLALVAWEVLDRRRVPVMSFLVIVSGWIVMTILPFSVSPNAQAIAYLLWSVPTILWMLVLLLRARPRPEVGRGDEEWCADQAEARPAAGELVAAHA
jgi:hypothetical protein